MNTFIFFLVLISGTAIASESFQECTVEAKLLKVSNEISEKSSQLTISVKMEPSKVHGKNKKNCKWMLGKKLDKMIEFQSKNALEGIKVGKVVMLDYSNFKTDDISMEIWKLINIKKTRFNLPD